MAFTIWLRNEWMKNIFLNDFLNFLVNYAFLTENHKFLEFRQTSILTFGYPGFQKKKRFCDKLIFKTTVKVNVHQVGPPTQILGTTNFRGNRTLTHVLEKNGKRENGETFTLNAWINDQYRCARIWKYFYWGSADMTSKTWSLANCE